MTSEDYYSDPYAHYANTKEEERSKEIFRKAIYENLHLFNNKIIMAIGCGTGDFVYISS
jgi:protein arginine N-methyltransferase 1